MEPADMQNEHPDSDAKLPGGVHRVNRAAANEHMPRSIWQPGVVKRLADYIKHLREVDQQSDKPDFADQPHVCHRNPHRSCNCPRGVCADDDATYRYARGPYRSVTPTPEPNEHGNFQCPISGKLCDRSTCRDWCESGVDYTKT